MELPERLQKILECLRKYQDKGGIDTFKLSYQAQNTRPSNEIVTLRKLGFNIATIPTKNKNTGKIYYRYLLLSEPEL